MVTLSTAQPARNPDPVVRAKGLAYLMWESPDLNRSEKFLNDFGLVTLLKSGESLLMRAYSQGSFCYWIKRGNKARFRGFAWALDSEEDLTKLARENNNAKVIDHPAGEGGKYVALVDPAGFEVHAVFGLRQYPALRMRSSMPHNTADRSDRINFTQRSDLKSEVVRLGHLVLEVANFQAVSAWYTKNFGLIPSDVQVLPDGSPAVVFMRLDLASEPADHHTLAIAQGFMSLYSHSAYEVMDADAVGMGQRLLRERGYSHAWGIGRHILGSQIFDYWKDTWGFKHEHYSDGDRFTADHPMGISPVTRDAMSQWGQAMPRSFTKPVLNLNAIIALIRNLRKVPDLTVQKLRILANLFG